MKNKKLTEAQLEVAYEEIEQMLKIMDEIYYTNLEWLKKNHKDIYKLVKKEAKSILKDTSKEKFCVELNKKGALDIINRRDNSYFYNTDPFIRGDNIAKQLTQKSIAFDGVGLGTHITSAIKFNKPKKVLICEDDIQLFRCSMYITDYSELSSLTKLKITLSDKCKNKNYDKVFKIK